jgi:hypothetical protein
LAKKFNTSNFSLIAANPTNFRAEESNRSTTREHCGIESQRDPKA